MNLPFSFIFIFLLVPAIAVFAIIYTLLKRKRTEDKLSCTGMFYLDKLYSLLKSIRLHRDLTTDFLNGKSASELEIEKIEMQVRKEISNIGAIEGRVQQSNKWDSIVDHWMRIGKHYHKLTPDVNLRQHNNLIANLLYLIDDIRYAHHLEDPISVQSEGTDWRNPLLVAEYIGQARALGVGALNKGICSNAFKIQLDHLLAKIESNIKPDWPAPVKQDFYHLLGMTRKQVIADQPTGSPEEYFKLSTTCIEHVLIEFDKQAEQTNYAMN